jgi:hypothetical protein
MHRFRSLSSNPAGSRWRGPRQPGRSWHTPYFVRPRDIFRDAAGDQGFFIFRVLVRHVQLMQAEQETNVFAQNLESIRTVEDNRSPVDKLGNLWCTLMHDSLSWPIHGQYTCLTCGRQHLVRWEREVFTSPEASKNADLRASAEHFNSASAVLDNSNPAFTRLQ